MSSSRTFKTGEVIISKLFPAGCGWQAASILAESANYIPTSLPFFLTVGLGEGLAVGIGHITYYTIKKNIAHSNINLKEQIASSLQLGTAATMSGTIWQPSVNLFSSYGFFPSSIGTLCICGLTFYSGLRFSRSLYGNFLGMQLEKKTKENNVNDMLLSVSVAGAAGLFVATDVSLANNFLISYFGITDNMSNLAGIGTAGLSTACGFTGIQLFQNTFLKKNWID